MTLNLKCLIRAAQVRRAATVATKAASRAAAVEAARARQAPATPLPLAVLEVAIGVPPLPLVWHWPHPHFKSASGTLNSQTSPAPHSSHRAHSLYIRHRPASLRVALFHTRRSQPPIRAMTARGPQLHHSTRSTKGFQPVPRMGAQALKARPRAHSEMRPSQALERHAVSANVGRPHSSSRPVRTEFANNAHLFRSRYARWQCVAKSSILAFPCTWHKPKAINIDEREELANRNPCRKA